MIRYCVVSHMSRRWVIYKMVKGQRQFMWSGPFGTTQFAKHLHHEQAKNVYSRLRTENPDGEYRLLSER